MYTCLDTFRDREYEVPAHKRDARLKLVIIRIGLRCPVKYIFYDSMIKPFKDFDISLLCLPKALTY